MASNSSPARLSRTTSSPSFAEQSREPEVELDRAMKGEQTAFAEDAGFEDGDDQKSQTPNTSSIPLWVEDDCDSQLDDLLQTGASQGTYEEAQVPPASVAIASRIGSLAPYMAQDLARSANALRQVPSYTQPSHHTAQAQFTLSADQLPYSSPYTAQGYAATGPPTAPDANAASVFQTHSSAAPNVCATSAYPAFSNFSAASGHAGPAYVALNLYVAPNPNVATTSHEPPYSPMPYMTTGSSAANAITIDESETEIPEADPDTPAPLKRQLPWWWFKFYEDRDQWSNAVLPAVLGRLDPPRDWYTDPIPPDLFSTEDRACRDFRYLPQQNELSEIPSYEMEAYFRGHREFSNHDLWVRGMLGNIPNPDSKRKNAFSRQRGRQVRNPFKVRAWVLKHGDPPKILLKLLESLSREQMKLNTTWKVTPQGIVQPKNPNRTLPLDYYLDDDGGREHEPSEHVQKAMRKLVELQKLAVAHGLGQHEWDQLPENLLPKTWACRTKGRGKRKAQEDKIEDDEDGGSEAQDSNKRRKVSDEDRSFGQQAMPKNQPKTGNTDDMFDDEFNQEDFGTKEAFDLNEVHSNPEIEDAINARQFEESFALNHNQLSTQAGSTSKAGGEKNLDFDDREYVSPYHEEDKVDSENLEDDHDSLFGSDGESNHGSDEIEGAGDENTENAAGHRDLGGSSLKVKVNTNFGSGQSRPMLRQNTNTNLHNTMNTRLSEFASLDYVQASLKRSHTDTLALTGADKENVATSQHSPKKRKLLFWQSQVHSNKENEQPSFQPSALWHAPARPSPSKPVHRQNLIDTLSGAQTQPHTFPAWPSRTQTPLLQSSVNQPTPNSADSPLPRPSPTALRSASSLDQRRNHNNIAHLSAASRPEMPVSISQPQYSYGYNPYANNKDGSPYGGGLNPQRETTGQPFTKGSEIQASQRAASQYPPYIPSAVEAQAVPLRLYFQPHSSQPTNIPSGRPVSTQQSVSTLMRSSNGYATGPFTYGQVNSPRASWLSTPHMFQAPGGYAAPSRFQSRSAQTGATVPSSPLLTSPGYPLPPTTGPFVPQPTPHLGSLFQISPLSSKAAGKKPESNGNFSYGTVALQCFGGTSTSRSVPAPTPGIKEPPSTKEIPPPGYTGQRAVASKNYDITQAGHAFMAKSPGHSILQAVANLPEEWFCHPHVCTSCNYAPNKPRPANPQRMEIKKRYENTNASKPSKPAGTPKGLWCYVPDCKLCNNEPFVGHSGEDPLLEKKVEWNSTPSTFNAFDLPAGWKGYVNGKVDGIWLDRGEFLEKI